MHGNIWFPTKPVKSNMMARFAEFGIEVDSADPRLDKLIRTVKEREFEGWALTQRRPVSNSWRVVRLVRCRNTLP